MKIPGIAYIIIGLFMSGLSGYVYKFIPKPDGTPNMSMALFFFIGILFIIVGFIKLFFKKMDEEKEIEYHKTKHLIEKNTNVHNHNISGQAPKQATQRNRIEEQVDNAVKQQEATQQHITQQKQHSSSYAKTHPYQGIRHNDVTNQNNTHHAGKALTIVVCKRCGDKNPSTTNYCYGCGNRLR